MRWMYGVTTVPGRRATHLPETLKSLEVAGFDRPHLFVDGELDATSYRREFDLDVTAHYPSLRAVGNWITSLWTLYVLDPSAHRFAIFQDDVTLCLGVKEYLDAIPWTDRSYRNLYTSEHNERIAAKSPQGSWQESYVLNCGPDGRGPDPEQWQTGKGALALVFDGEAVLKLLSSHGVANKPQDLINGHHRLDGMVVNAMNQAGFRELVHCPSLCQHAGQHDSSMGHDPRPLARSFPGEGFDARTFLRR